MSRRILSWVLVFIMLFSTIPPIYTIASESPNTMFLEGFVFFSYREFAGTSLIRRHLPNSQITVFYEFHPSEESAHRRFTPLYSGTQDIITDNHGRFLVGISNQQAIRDSAAIRVRVAASASDHVSFVVRTHDQITDDTKALRSVHKDISQNPCVYRLGEHLIKENSTRFNA
jgi:hypothetical protein